MSFSKPSDLPVWATDPGALIQAPTTGKQQQGWTTTTGLPTGVGEKPPLQYLNWQMNLVYQWLAWINQVLGSATGLGTMASQNANAVAITGGQINGTQIGASAPADADFLSAFDNGEIPTEDNQLTNKDYVNSPAANNLLPKAMASVSFSAGVYNIDPGSYNVASLTRNDVGNITVTFTNPMPAGTYIVLANIQDEYVSYASNHQARTVNGFEILLFDTTDDNTLIDAGFCFSVFYNG